LYHLLTAKVKSKARSARALYIEVSKGYSPPYSIEKKYFIATQKRNLLLRRRSAQSTNLNRRLHMNADEDTRIKGFRQLKKEIRGSEGYLIIGIDVAKDKHHAFFGTATGKTLLRRLIFENSIDEFEKLIAYAEAIKEQHSLEKVVFGLDPIINPQGVS